MLIRKNYSPKLNIIGQRFGDLEVIGPAERRGTSVYWLCECICKNTKFIAYKSLKCGRSISCGCSKVKGVSIGERFYKFTIIGGPELRSYGGSAYSQWKCICDCGKIKWLRRSEIQNRTYKSCGCIKKDKAGVHSIIENTYGGYKRGAKRRNLQFELTKEDFLKYVFGKCHYCGINPCNTIKHQSRSEITLKLNGIDRMDNSFGYLKENCVSCCKKCNIAKSVMGKQEFLRWISDVWNYSILKRDLGAFRFYNGNGK